MGNSLFPFKLEGRDMVCFYQFSSYLGGQECVCLVTTLYVLFEGKDDSVKFNIVSRIVHRFPSTA